MKPNYNELSLTNAKLEIPGLSNVNYWIQNFSIPNISLEENFFATPYLDINLPGHKTTFDPITVNFIVDDHLDNYFTMVEWLQSFKEAKKPNLIRKDISIHILGPDKSIRKVITIKGAYPTNISELPFTSTINAEDYMQCSVSLNYTSFS